MENLRKAAEVYTHACKSWRVIFPIRERIGLPIIYRIFHPNKKMFGGIELMDPVFSYQRQRVIISRIHLELFMGQ